MNDLGLVRDWLTRNEGESEPAWDELRVILASVPPTYDEWRCALCGFEGTRAEMDKHHEEGPCPSQIVTDVRGRSWMKHWPWLVASFVLAWIAVFILHFAVNG